MRNEGATEASTALSTEPAPRAARAVAAPLLERERELAELGALLDEARAGFGRLLLIEGPAGIGKTRLLKEATAAARARGLEILTARGGELERDFGFGIVRQLLEPVLASGDRVERERLLAGAAHLAETIFAPPEAEAAEGPDATHAVLHGLYWLVANLAEHSPLLIAIDDVQWADGPSQRFLIHLARRLEGVRSAVIATRRAGDRGAEPDLLHALTLEAVPPVLRPATLTEKAVELLVRSTLGEQARPALCRACYEATGGNPFLLQAVLEELAIDGRSPSEADPETVRRLGPSRIAAAILFRIGRLGRGAPELARAVAVLGERASLMNAAALAALDRAAAGSLANALIEARVLEPGAPLRFVHPVVRTAIYEDIPRAERAEMHARAAQLIAAESAEPEAVAIHLLAAEPAGEERVVELLRNAARAALSRGAPETAALYLRRAVEEPPSAPIHSELALELASAAARAGDSDALQLLSSAFTTAKRQPLRARAGLQLGAALLGTVARIGEAIDVLEHALEGVHDPELATRLEAMLLLGGVSTPAAHGRVAGRLARTRARVDDFPLDQARPLLSPLSWHLVVADGDAAGGARLAERALGGGELLREEIKTGMVLTAPPIWALSLAGHLEIAERAADDVIAQARARGARIVLARASAFRASVRHRRGRLAGAEADARSCIELAGASAQPLLHPIASASLIAVLLERADTEAARQALRDVEVGLYDPELAPTQPLRESRARLLMAEGDPRGALEELLAYARWEREWQAGAGVVPVAWRSSAALASKMLGDAARARRLAEEELELARGFGVAAPIGTALRTLALVEGRESGIELLDEAVSVLQESEARLEYARAVTDLGAMLRHVGLRSMAIPKLRDGMDAAHRCGATALVDFAREELRLAGARPTRIALTGRDALTPAERRVAALACDGMRNKEIAQALFVTQRTVEMHLSNAYRKLGVSSREELPSALEDQ